MNKNTSLRSLIAAMACLTPFAVNAMGYLENPVAGGVESGIGLVSGWHCTAREIRVYIDGVDIGKSGVGSVRNDTDSICRANNTGFSLLYNFSKLTPGKHSISVYADGVHLETREFRSIRPGNVPFLEGASRVVPLYDFPEIGKTTLLQWRQSRQNFVIEESIDDGSSGAFATLLSYGGTFYGTIFHKTLPVSGDPTKFTFELEDGLLKLTRESTLSGTCVFKGSYTNNPGWVDSRGTYVCDDSSSGTYSAGALQVTGYGSYSGIFSFRAAGGTALDSTIQEIQMGQNPRFGSQP